MLSRRQLSLTLAGAVIAPAALRARTDGVDDAREAASGLAQLHAIMIRRADETVLAIAPRGPGLGRPANIKSCAKSVLALILGAVVARGEIANVSARLGDVAPALIPADATEGVADLTMADLVTLRGGLESTSGPRYGGWISSGNWVSHALRQPRVSPNGGRMIYSTGTTHVLGAAIAVATGQSLLQLARERLDDGLGLSIGPWTRDPQGYYLGGNEMALTPEAMLRIAVLMRDGGRYNGRQVVPQDWIDASRQPQTRSPWSGLAYGYGWFLSDSGWTLARGFGGQIIAAHPERALAVAITSDPTRTARSEGYFGDLMRLLDGPVLALG